MVPRFHSGSWPPLRGFAITLTGHITLGRIPLDEWSARFRYLYRRDTTPSTSPGHRAAADLILRRRGNWDNDDDDDNDNDDDDDDDDDNNNNNNVHCRQLFSNSISGTVGTGKASRREYARSEALVTANSCL
jgi:hypothetical protein